MFSKSITIVLTMLFILYSNSISVVWMLYFYEKEDIILYFCPYDSQNGGDGTAYIQRMLDGDTAASRSKSTAPRVLISQESTVYLLVEPEIPIILPKSPILFGEYQHTLHLGYYPSVFRPPLS